MFKFIRHLLIIGAALGVLLGGSAWYLTGRNSSGDEANEMAVATPPIIREEEIEVAVLVVQFDTEERTLLWCQGKICQRQTPPSIATSDAVFDGQWWYDYIEREENNGQTKRVLQRVATASNQHETIVEQTPLVSPRELIISPNGRYIAYWLDNIHEPQKKLTELWVYDTSSQSTYVLAENIFKPDVRTKVRWNSAATQLAFIGNSAERGKPERLELLVASVQPPAISARFKSNDLSQLESILEHAVMDISPNGAAVAYAHQSLPAHSELITIREGKGLSRITVEGTIPYLQWFEDGSLLYAVQDARGVTFWKHQADTSKHIARSSGTLLTAQGDPRGRYVTFIETAEKKTTLRILNIEQGKSTALVTLPRTAQQVHIAKVELTQREKNDISTTLDDAQLAAFIERHIAEITEIPQAKPLRFSMTEQANTVYIDFYDKPEKPERLLVIVHDAVHPEWSILARYESKRGQWQQVQGRGVNEPAPVRLYEWEEKVGRWILKDDLSNQ